MHHEAAVYSEGLTTVLAHIWLLPSVNPLVSDEIPFLDEDLATVSACIRLLPNVHPVMPDETLVTCE